MIKYNEYDTHKLQKEISKLYDEHKINCYHPSWSWKDFSGNRHNEEIIAYEIGQIKDRHLFVVMFAKGYSHNFWLTDKNKRNYSGQNESNNICNSIYPIQCLKTTDKAYKAIMGTVNDNYYLEHKLVNKLKYAPQKCLKSTSIVDNLISLYTWTVNEVDKQHDILESKKAIDTKKNKLDSLSTKAELEEILDGIDTEKLTIKIDTTNTRKIFSITNREFTDYNHYGRITVNILKSANKNLPANSILISSSILAKAITFKPEQSKLAYDTVKNLTLILNNFTAQGCQKS